MKVRFLRVAARRRTAATRDSRQNRQRIVRYKLQHSLHAGLDPIIATTVDDEIVKLRDLQHVTSIVVTHQIRDPYYIATDRAVSENGRARIVPGEATTVARAEFMVLHDGRIRFSGSAAESLASRDPYLKDFLFRTLPPW